MCIVTNNWCWSRRHICFGNVVIVVDCHLYPTKVTSLACQIGSVFCPFDYAFDHCCWDDCWGVKNRLIEGTCDSLLFSCSISIWWKSTYVVTCCWSSLLGASTSWIPSTWECGYSCGWTTSWTSWCGASNSNCLLRPLVTILDISQKSLIQIFFWSLGC